LRRAGVELADVGLAGVRLAFVGLAGVGLAVVQLDGLWLSGVGLAGFEVSWGCLRLAGWRETSCPLAFCRVAGLGGAGYRWAALRVTD